MAADPQDVELGERNPNMNESYADSIGSAPSYNEPARSDFIGMRFAENDPAVNSLGRGESETDLGLGRGGYENNDIGQRLGKEPVYSNPRYSSPQRSKLRRLPSLDRLPSRAGSASTVNAPPGSTSASTADLVDSSKTPKDTKDPSSPKSKIKEFCTNPKYEKPRALALIILLIIVLILIIVLPITLRSQEEPEKKPLTPTEARPSVKIFCAWLEGSYEKNISVYKGIPYALPPTGRNRWQPPRPLDTTAKCKLKFVNSTVRATSFGPKCYQRLTNGFTGGDEDCLTLNVWTPTNKSDAKLPVIVYIHGGQLTFGGGRDIGVYGVHKFTQQYKVLVVSFNYRLGPLGFLALEEFPDYRANRTAGNYGLMDQIAVLKWVKENIEQFGGDPNKVTLLGWESGGSSALALANSERATRLFKRVWIMDGGLIRDQTLNDTMAANSKFVGNAGCGKANADQTMDCLYALEPGKVMEHMGWHAGDAPAWQLSEMYDVPKKDQFMAAILSIDGYIVKNTTLNHLATKPLENQVDIVFGTGENSADLDPPYFDNGNFPHMTQSERARVESTLGGFQVSLRLLYTDTYRKNTLTAEEAFTRLVTDMRARCPMDDLVGKVAKAHSQNVYRYIFNARAYQRIDGLSRGYQALYAFRGMDMLAAFGALTDHYSYYFRGLEKFEEIFQKSLAEFAKNGQITGWNIYPNEFMVVNKSAVQNKQITDKSYVDCQLFTNAGVDASYAWVN